jgi:hypothetical protein
MVFLRRCFKSRRLKEVKMNLKTKLLEDGYITIKNVFSTEEINLLRKIIKSSLKTCKVMSSYGGITQPNAACVVTDLAYIFHHPKVLSTMRELLSTSDIMFTSHCDVHSRTLSGWHKDDGMTVMNNGYFEQPTYDLDNCRVYKVAIYLQDHHRNLAGLRVRRKSHHLADLGQGEEVYLGTQAGDMIVFDVRITHTGQTDIVPIPWLRKPIGLIRRAMNKLFRVPHNKIDCWLKNIYDCFAGDRLSVFFTFGANNEHTIKFAQNNMLRQINQDPRAPIYLPKHLREKLLENKVLLAEDYFADLKPLDKVTP